MAESFVNTYKRDYVSRMDLSDARTVLAQVPAAFEHFNEAHPNSSLKMKSPREFRRQRVEQLRSAQPEQLALRYACPCPELKGQEAVIHRVR
jgi:transposase InsO family protein